MAKMVAMKRTKSERDEADTNMPSSMPDSGGEPEVHLDDHHLSKLGADGPYEVGHKIAIHGEGEVTHHSDDENGGRRMSIKIKRMDKEPFEKEEKSDDQRSGLKGDLRESMKASEEKSAAKDAKAGKKVAEG